MPAVELDAARLVGGSEADRSRVLERLHEYLEANASFDWGQLQDIWSGAPEAVFFNLSPRSRRAASRWRFSSTVEVLDRHQAAPPLKCVAIAECRATRR
jgi:hypothetical protein